MKENNIEKGIYWKRRILKKEKKILNKDDIKIKDIKNEKYWE